jgi:hypothetical protein
MQTESNEKKKGGRPKGFSPKTETKPMIQEDGEYVILRIKKKELAKLLLKDLI